MKGRDKQTQKEEVEWRIWFPRLAFFFVALTLFGLAYDRGKKNGSGAGRNSPAKTEMESSDPHPDQRWGNVACQQVLLERPDEFITSTNLAPRFPIWFFGRVQPSAILNLFENCPMTVDQRRILCDTNSWHVTIKGRMIHPPTNIVFELDPVSRAIIYGALARFPENYEQQHPFTFPVAEGEGWLVESSLSSSTLDVVKKVLYRRGASLCFSDLSILASIPSEDERRRLIKTLARVPTIVMRLRISPDSNINALLDYWGKNRSKDMRPLLESFKRLPKGGEIDVADLFPPFARSRLYNFPDKSDDPLSYHEDCGWTSMNFFSYPPESRFLSPESVVRALASEYAPIQTEPSFGDVVTLVDRNDVYVHMCVYIADDVVFTKNGGSFYEPWTLMKLSEVRSTYELGQKLRVMIFRKKTPAESSRTGMSDPRFFKSQT